MPENFIEKPGGFSLWKSGLTFSSSHRDLISLILPDSLV